MQYFGVSRMGVPCPARFSSYSCPVSSYPRAPLHNELYHSNTLELHPLFRHYTTLSLRLYMRGLNMPLVSTYQVRHHPSHCQPEQETPVDGQVPTPSQVYIGTASELSLARLHLDGTGSHLNDMAVSSSSCYQYVWVVVISAQSWTITTFHSAISFAALQDYMLY